MVQLSLLFTKRSSTLLIMPRVYNDNAKLRKNLHKCKHNEIFFTIRPILRDRTSRGRGTL